MERSNTRRCMDCGSSVRHFLTRHYHGRTYVFCLDCANEPPTSGHRCRYPDLAHQGPTFATGPARAMAITPKGQALLTELEFQRRRRKAIQALFGPGIRVSEWGAAGVRQADGWR
jgi:hypothetical protein